MPASDLEPFGLVVLLVSGVGLVAVLANRVSERIQVPAPLLFLGGAAVTAQIYPGLQGVPHRAVERIVTVALIVILFDGGLQIGWRRLRPAAGAVLTVGVLGTFLTAGAVATLAHLAFGFGWYVALLIGTAVAPTDPAIVFSVLGQREVTGRSGTILEGESGANDPVGIALMVGLLSAGHLSGGSVATVAGTFALQMAVGGAIGLAGGLVVRWFIRTVSLPSEGLYPLSILAAAGLVFGVATAAHGSGFLAVFSAGIALGDLRAPFKREVERFQSALASLGEIVAFVVLGLTVDLAVLAHRSIWLPGLLLAAALTFVIRPVLAGACLLPFRLARNEQVFVLWAGLKGAVPILLASLVLTAGIPDPDRLYGIVVVVVTFSVLVQGSTVPLAARLLNIPVHLRQPEPWAVGVRLRDEPHGVFRRRIATGSPAEGRAVGDVGGGAQQVWVSMIVRDGRLLTLTDRTRLRAGDDVLVLAAADGADAVDATFGAPRD